MARLEYIFPLFFVCVISASVVIDESQNDNVGVDSNNEGLLNKRARNPYSWMETKRAKNPYSWMTEQGKRARNPYSWLAKEKGIKRSPRFAEDGLRQPRNPYSWMYSIFEKRTRNPYSWMNE